DYKAKIKIHVESSLVPLHAGTTAQVRVPSLSSVANRYILLTPAPNHPNPPLPPGSTLPASATKEVVDLDQLFNTLNPKTRLGLQRVIQGSAEQYAGTAEALGHSTELFAPSLAATDHFFAQLVRDQPVFTSFLVQTSRAVTTIGARNEDLSALIGHMNETFQVLGSQQANLAAGLKQLPLTLEQGNHTFAEPPSTIGALTELASASRPTSQPLDELFTRLQPLIRTAEPVLRNFDLAISRPGPNNDLIDFAN